jgi:hypothetical protein
MLWYDLSIQRIIYPWRMISSHPSFQSLQLHHIGLNGVAAKIRIRQKSMAAMHAISNEASWVLSQDASTPLQIEW